MLRLPIVINLELFLFLTKHCSTFIKMFFCGLEYLKKIFANGGQTNEEIRSCFIGVEAIIIVLDMYTGNKAEFHLKCARNWTIFVLLYWPFWWLFGFYYWVLLSFLPCLFLCTPEEYAKINKYFINISFHVSSILNKHKFREKPTSPKMICFGRVFFFIFETLGEHFYWFLFFCCWLCRV